MPDQTARELKLVQYLNEAYGKERELETALQAHIKMTTRDAYKKRLQAHLKETKGHARDVKARIRKLGGKAEENDAVPGPDVVKDVAGGAASVASKAVALAQGPLHMLRGTGEQEKLLKNAKSEYADEAEEIATYTAIETLAETLGDGETAKLARSIRRDEERMASYLAKLIPTLTRAVVQEEIPPSERKPASPSRRSPSSRATSTRSRSNGARGGSSSTAKRPSASRAKPASKRSRAKATSSSA